MKKKLIEKTPPVKTRKGGWQVTIQEVKDVLVLNVWENKKLYARHAVNVVTHDFATWREKDQAWFDAKLEFAIGMTVEIYGDQYWHGQTYERLKKERWHLLEKDEKRIRELFEPKRSHGDGFQAIARAESDRKRNMRETAEERRWKRVCDMMDRVPAIPDDLLSWSERKLTGGEDWLLKNKSTKDWHCSACGGTVKDFDEKKVKNNDVIQCPICNLSVRIRKRKSSIMISDRVMLIQPIDEEVSVARHFKVTVSFEPHEGEKKVTELDENARLILTKDPKEKRACIIYWEQWGRFDDESNPAGQRITPCYLYDGNADKIEEAFRGTEYEPWSRLFPQFARSGIKLDYNCMMIGVRNERYVSMMEMLFRGRFLELMKGESENISVWSYGYVGSALDINGKTIEEVFRIEDRQKINRIRDANGGHKMLAWMQWSDEYGEKLPDEQLKWLERNNVHPVDAGIITEHMTVVQAINYVKRQQAESYWGKSAKIVIDQYEDYIRMCKRLKKNTADEMVYRPRELKRRHDEAVQEIAAREAELQAAEYSRKYKEAEKVLKEIRTKFEYAGESYRIIVPRKIVDVVKEGRVLHHCAGSTDRYFDRIKQHETYIVFLRKIEEPDTPFYTIEVEPGGAIRQHRGMYDEEPDLDKVKPFLKEWQGVIRQRMTQEDHEKAAVSKKKREANIAELKEKNNARVLQGLMEDFMEAM